MSTKKHADMIAKIASWPWPEGTEFDEEPVASGTAVLVRVPPTTTGSVTYDHIDRVHAGEATPYETISVFGTSI